MFNRNCLECGAPFKSTKAHAAYCCTAHRMKWNARRSDRGAELYDLCSTFMHGDEMTQKEFIIELAMQCGAYQQSDQHLRAGRQSWQDWKKARMSLPRVYGTEGDKR